MRSSLLFVLLALSMSACMAQTSGRFTMRILASGEHNEVLVAEKGKCLGFATIVLVPDGDFVMVELYEFDEKGLAEQEPVLYFASGKVIRDYVSGIEKFSFSCVNRINRKGLGEIIISRDNGNFDDFMFYVKYEDNTLMYAFVE